MPGSDEHRNTANLMCPTMWSICTCTRAGPPLAGRAEALACSSTPRQWAHCLRHDPSAGETHGVAGMVLAVLVEVANGASHFVDGGDPVERDSL